jgi:hypothetical protein
MTATFPRTETDPTVASAVAAEASARVAADALKQDAATAASDVELASVRELVPLPRFTAAHAFGNSYVEGAGTDVVPAHGFAHRIAAALGLQRTELANHAISGSIAMHDSVVTNCGHWAVLRALAGDVLSTTAAGATSVPAALAGTATITVQTNAAFGATAAFPQRGRLRHTNALGQTQTLSYTGVTASTFTGVTGMVRAIASGDVIERVVTKRQQRPYLPWPEGENRLCIVGPYTDLLSEGSAAIPKMVSALRAMISRALATQVVADGTTLLFALSGMTPVGNTAGLHSGERAYSANAVGSYAEAVFPVDLPPGSVLAMGGLIRQGQTATIEVKVDGVTHGTLDIGVLAPTTASKYNAWAYRIDDADPYEAHTVRVTFTAQGAAGHGLIDWAHVESPVPAPRVLVYGPPDLASTTISYPGASTRDEQVTITQAARDAVEALVEEFEHPTIGFNPVGFVDTYEALAGDDGRGDSDLFNADETHPNEDGHQALTVLGLETLRAMNETAPTAESLVAVL